MLHIAFARGHRDIKLMNATLPKRDGTNVRSRTQRLIFTLRTATQRRTYEKVPRRWAFGRFAHEAAQLTKNTIYWLGAANSSTGEVPITHAYRRTLLAQRRTLLPQVPSLIPMEFAQGDPLNSSFLLSCVPKDPVSQARPTFLSHPQAIRYHHHHHCLPLAVSGLAPWLLAAPVKRPAAAAGLCQGAFPKGIS
jgi:hypothetical protein